MNLDELQSVQSRERQTDSLQQLRESFYEDAGEFVQKLREERDRVADRAEDPFDSPEVNRLSDDITTAEQTVEAIYERRVGKIVKMASLAAADMPTDDEGLTREERDLFETLVGAIETNREHVLDVLAGDASPDAVSGGSDSPDATGDPATPEAGPARTDAAPRAESGETEQTGPGASDAGVGAADVMGREDETTREEIPPPPEAPPEGDGQARASPPSGGAPDGERPDEEAASDGGEPGRAGATPADSTSADQAATPGGGVDRTTVRITNDVGTILGVDQREYDLSTDDVVTLPADNAEPLVQRDAAERLE